MSKGDWKRRVNKERFDRNFEEAFGKAPPHVPTWDPTDDPGLVSYLDEHREPEDEGDPVYRCGVCHEQVDPADTLCSLCGRRFIPFDDFVEFQAGVEVEQMTSGGAK